MRTSVRDRIVRLGAGRRLRPFGWAAAAALLALSVLAPAGAGAANPPSPTYGTAVVDGSIVEWNLSADRFAAMREDGYPNKPVVAYLYLRYDCASSTLYALVLGEDGVVFRQTRPENAYIRIDGSGKLFSGNSGNNGTPPDFAWVDGDGTYAAGYEGSGKLDPGTYTVRAHVLQPDNSADGYKEIDNTNRDAPLVIECAKPSASAEASESARASASTDPGTSPSSGVEGSSSKPKVTLPPTDTLGGGEPPTTSLGLVFLGLGLVLAGALVLIEKPRLGRGRRDS